MNTINRFINTGRELLAVEKRLETMDPRDPDRPALSAQHSQLMRRQQDEMVAAVDAGVGWETVRFALELHGQDANRDQHHGEPTPAEILGEAMRVLGPERFIAALDAMRAEHAAG